MTRIRRKIEEAIRQAESAIRAAVGHLIATSGVRPADGDDVAQTLRIHVAATGTTAPAPVTPKGDRQTENLVARFKAISDPKEQTLFWRSLTDPETGLTFGYLRFTDTRANKVFVTIECLYGFKTAIADGIKRIVKP